VTIQPITCEAALKTVLCVCMYIYIKLNGLAEDRVQYCIRVFAMLNCQPLFQDSWRYYQRTNRGVAKCGYKCVNGEEAGPHKAGT
jgi:hypothetical protein